jgi:hypothetical protein
MPSQSRLNSSGMGYERKRQYPDASAASSSSSFARHAFAMHDQARSASPPASTYFPLLSGDSGARLRPTADAESHFAYSTTLRRHGTDGLPLSPVEIASAVNAEASSLWSRAVSVVTGQPLETSVESGRATPPPMQDTRDTMSARFAHCSIEVSDRVHNFSCGFWYSVKAAEVKESSAARVRWMMVRSLRVCGQVRVRAKCACGCPLQVLGEYSPRPGPLHFGPGLPVFGT